MLGTSACVKRPYIREVCGSSAARRARNLFDLCFLDAYHWLVAGECVIWYAVAQRICIGATAVLLLMSACAPFSGHLPASSGPETAASTLKLRLAVTTTPIPALTSSVLWLAQDLGYYQREGLDVDITELTGAPVAITALQAGDVDVATLTLLDTLRLNASQTLGVRAFGASGSDDFPFIVARSTIASISELRGKSFAVSRVGAADDSTARRMLAANGVDPADVNFVAVGAPNVRAQALLAGQIDATTVQISTWVTLRGTPGLSVLASMDQIRAVVPNSVTLNVATTRTLSADAEQLQRFTSAVMVTARLFQTNKQAWLDAMSARRPDLAQSDLGFLWDQFASAWGVNGYLNLRDLQRQEDFAYQTTPEFAALPRINESEWIDTRLVDEALKKMGVFPGYDEPGRPIT
jgi:NitT/TauT family transport system substrate-binding protein